MTVYHIDENGDFVPKYKERTGQAGAYVISDTMPGMVHPANGKMYDSKAAFRSVTRMHGLTEVGNEVQRDRRDFSMTLPPVELDLKKVLERYRR